MTAPGGEAWAFHSDDVAADIEKDVFFADLAGPRHSAQIVLHFVIARISDIRWTLTRLNSQQ